jgi:HEAT repeats
MGVRAWRVCFWGWHLHSVGKFNLVAERSVFAMGGRWVGLLLVVLAGLAGGESSVARGQAGAPAPKAASTDESEGKAPVISPTSTPEERIKTAWTILTTAAADTKHAQTRIQALAALGMMNSPRPEKMIADAMNDADLDVRTAAALAAGQTKDRNLTTPLRNLLKDKEPQVVFTAAMTLWKMGDRSGEDILMAVVDGERSASPTLMNGTKQRINRELHDPAALTRLGATEGATMLLGPFGFGVTAFEYIRKNGGDQSRVLAMEQVAQERTEPIHKELIVALGDKDPTVRVAAAKALVDYRDKATSAAVYQLFADAKYPVRLTAAAAYLRMTGVPGPPVIAVAGNVKH